MPKFVRFIDAKDGTELFVNPDYVVTVKQKCPSAGGAEGICYVVIDTVETANAALAQEVRGELEEVIARLEFTGSPVKHEAPLVTPSSYL
jgi:hypothetical protein